MKTRSVGMLLLQKAHSTGTRAGKSCFTFNYIN